MARPAPPVATRHARWDRGPWATWVALAAITGLLVTGSTCLVSLQAYRPPALIAHVAGMGLLVALSQWLLLRWALAVGWRWVPATLLGILIGAGVALVVGAGGGGLVFAFSRAPAGSVFYEAAILWLIGAGGMAAGAVVGLAQVWLLAGGWRGGWVGASALGGIGAAHAVVPVLGPCGLGLPIGLLGWLAYGLLTGAVLDYLTRVQGRPAPAAGQDN
jgi:hypothetical protein